ncbi:RHS repeat-associated core domain-containing protein [Actinomadura rayongensis]|uniref:Type IV secretion protein Rhs n=1 Tax=Actinomadura rayongensis TaxID=1429076 RepID=A0A6I4W2Z6_9ACTN|nr:RHS repeat-associated core domain-containing protein [Actinomadura rayongensis]MXQ65009.1 type IV secretion protein Rhs [Actinomadura rayongensis]
MAGDSFRVPKGRRRGGHGGPDGGGRRRPGKKGRDGSDPKAASREPGKRSTTNDPIDIVTGEVLLVHTDVELPGTLPLTLGRTHVSSYRDGALFGTSWASSLDQRLELDAEAVHFFADDATVLSYPHASLPHVQFRPVEGRPWPLVLTAAGGYTITDTARGRTLHFPPPGEEHGWARLPLTAITDRNGNRVDLVYADGTLTELRHSGGYRVKVTTAPVDEEGDDRRVTALHLAADEGDIALIRYGYDADGRLTEIVNSSGRPLRLSYDEEGRLTAWHDRNGFAYRYEYDDQGRAVRGIGTDGFLNVHLHHDPANRTTVVTDALGHATVHRYNEQYQVTTETDPLGNTTSFTWDRHDDLLSRTDALGRTTRFVYDERGNLVETVRPDGARSTAEYDDLNLPTVVTEADGSVWRQSYDEHGNLVESVDPSGAVTRYGYHPGGHPASVTDPLGNTVRFAVNAAGLVTAMTDPLGNTTRYGYDTAGRPTSVVDPIGGVVRRGWTPEGRPAWHTTADGLTERWDYDATGNLVAHTAPTGLATRYEIGPFDRPVAQTGPDGARLEFAYDAELRLRSVTNASGLVWRYEYDAAGNLVAEHDFDGRTQTYAYDAAGRLVSRTNAAGQTVAFRHDAMGNVVEKRAGEQVATFAYDPAGRLVEAVNADARVAFVRDPLGRVTAETSHVGTLNSAYDRAGNRVRRRTPSGADSVWTYDPAGRPVRLDAGGAVLAFEHDAADREVRRRIGAGAQLVQQWDARHRLTAQTVWGRPAAPDAGEPRLLQHRTYGYDPGGDVAALGDRLGGDRRFELDAAGRVTTVHGQGWTERYAYDPAGDIVGAEWPAAGGPDAEATGSREYAGTLLHRAGRVRYEHDRQGRVVLRQEPRLSSRPASWRYHWDADDRLVGVETPDGSRWRYRYDALGRRVAKQRLAEDGAGILEQTDFVWDGPVLVERVHRVWSPGDNAYVGDGMVWEYEPGTFRPVAQIEREMAPEWVDRQFYAIVADLVGSPVEMVDEAGDVAWARRSTLWGAALGDASGRSDCPLRFPGQYHDAETRLNYNHNRYFDPSTGRYLSRDPLGLMGGVNPFAYVPNPWTWYDPLGLTPRRGGGHTTHSALANGQGVTHGRTYTAIGDDPVTHANAGRLDNGSYPTRGNAHDVIVHGSRDGWPIPGNGHKTHPAQIAEAIANNPNYQGGPIRLLSCHSGNRRGWAQELANTMGVPVWAPTNRVRALRNGDTEIDRGGKWKKFCPQG